MCRRYINVSTFITSRSITYTLLRKHRCIVSDKTKWERDLFRAAYADLESRQGIVETDLIISYVNGIPKAIDRSLKN